FFFFQAEDGIRDFHVTGVQTCALPILPLRHTKTEVLQLNVGKLCNLTCIHCHVNAGPKRKEIMTRATIDQLIDWLAKTDIPTVRSEERRVGKEGRPRWGR